MALVTPVSYEVIPTGATGKIDHTPWVIHMHRASQDDEVIILKDDKALRRDGVWVDIKEDEELPPDCFVEFGEAVIIACQAVDRWEVNGKTYASVLLAS